MTHTNDISFRFLTPLRNTLLFKTEVGSNIGDDYIQAELVDGIAKVTFNAGGHRKVCYWSFYSETRILGFVCLHVVELIMLVLPTIM